MWIALFRLEQHKSNFFRGDLLAAPVEQVVLQVPISDAELERLKIRKKTRCRRGARGGSDVRGTVNTKG